MRAKDIMCREVTTVRPDTDVRAISSTLVSREISAVPVVDGEGRVVGIVSEGDLMRRQEIGTAGRFAWWQAITSSDEARAAVYVKSHGGTAADVMTRPVIAVDPDTDLAEIADIFEKYGIKRVPVIEAGELVGIVSRADFVGLLRTTLSRGGSEADPTKALDDRAMRRAIIDGIRAAGGVDSQFVYVGVHDGAVDLWGAVKSKVEKRAVELAVEASAPGRPVEDRLMVVPGDTISGAI